MMRKFIKKHKKNVVIRQVESKPCCRPQVTYMSAKVFDACSSNVRRALSGSRPIPSLQVTVLLGLLMCVSTHSLAQSTTIVVRWNSAALQGDRDSTIGPPMIARVLAIAHTCMYDAWAAYDAKAVGTQLGGSLRRPPAERTLANKQKAISFAAYRALVDLFPSDQGSVYDPLMASLGYD